MRRSSSLLALLVLLDIGCAAFGETYEHAQARANRDNALARAGAEADFLRRKALTPGPAPTKNDVRASQAFDPVRCAPEEVREVVVSMDGEVLAMEPAAVCRLFREGVGVVGTAEDPARPARSFVKVPRDLRAAVDADGRHHFYVLIPQTSKIKRSFLEGVACCCDDAWDPERRMLEPFSVLFDLDAVQVEQVPYDAEVIQGCDPRAPQ
jgi:hypothetical protein